MKKRSLSRTTLLSALLMLTPGLPSAEILEQSASAQTITESYTTLPMPGAGRPESLVFLQTQELFTSDSYTTRIGNVTANDFQARVQEHQVNDTEVSHLADNAAILVGNQGTITNTDGAIVGEIGMTDVELTSSPYNLKNAANWHSVVLSRSYSNPIVVVQVMSENNSTPLLVRLKKLERNSFRIGLKAWGSTTVPLVAEKLAYMVMESGHHRFSNGLEAIVGKVILNNNRRGTVKSVVTFEQTLPSKARVFSHIQTYNGPDDVVSQNGPTSENKLTLRLRELDYGSQKHTGEQVGYMAFGKADQSGNDLINAYRFLSQATLGARPGDAEALLESGYNAWFDEQKRLAEEQRSLTLPYLMYLLENTPDGLKPMRLPDVTVPYLTWKSNTAVNRKRIVAANFSTPWMRNVVNNDDDLNQRVTWHLSQLFVTSYATLSRIKSFLGTATGSYYDTLSKHALGNYRDLIEDVTYHPLMADYLTYRANSRAVGESLPDENYARELMQLFSIGLWELDEYGRQVLDNDGNPIPTYSQDDITNLARVFTGLSIDGFDWGYYDPNRDLAVAFTKPLAAFENYHDTDSKVLFQGKPWQTVFPAGQTTGQDISQALDAIFNHPNTPVYFSQRFIQYLVKSNPSPDYVKRVSDVFRDNGDGVRGDIFATVKAILTDVEAREANYALVDDTHGKLQEPVIRLTRMVRAFDAGKNLPKTMLGDLQFWGWDEYGYTYDLPQWPMHSPSVFNYFSPFYQDKPDLASLDLSSPEFQIHTDSTSVQLANNLAKMIDDRIHDKHMDVTPKFAFDFTREVALAGDHEALIRHLDLYLCNGLMSDSTFNHILSNLDSAASLSDLNRVKLAVWLVAISPDAAVLK